MSRQWENSKMVSNRRLPAAQPLNSRWRRFQRRIEHLPREERYDSLSSSHARALEIFHGSDEAPKHLFFFTRGSLCLNWKLEQRFPRNWHVLSRVGIPTESFLRTIRCYV